MGSGKSLSTSEITTSDMCSPANAAHRISRTKKLTRSERSQKPNVSPTASSKTKWQKRPRNKLEAVAPLKNACTICSKCLARRPSTKSVPNSASSPHEVQQVRLATRHGAPASQKGRQNLPVPLQRHRCPIPTQEARQQEVKSGSQ